MLTLEQKSKAIVDALEDIKANDITVINTSKQSQLFDQMIIASGTSNRQTRALADNVIKKMQELGVQVYSSEGEKSGEWVLIDLGEILVHVMQPGVRAYYNLEELWGKHPPRP
jgi:ribosome-associated protein